ncbi:hypothetical protein KBY91_19135 [Streptomyces sp. RK23]|uniref:hypothetical protein n=1 Tax=unclassified Streptomyces TaxID=2593676 RepID=UPI001B370020|nr:MULTISPECIES: hypothetical protein [unclassified Streptomyces]MBQ0963465.1 hypothetical protein [Streptomyces sp. RK74B]MBQ1005521.1 hypothetical protein [Streptomyces sp. RK23]
MHRISLGALITIAVVALYASFHHLSRTIQGLGRTPVDSYVLALAVDLFVLVCLAMVWYKPGTTPRRLLVIGILFTASTNAYGGYADSGWFGAGFALIPVSLFEMVYHALRWLSRPGSDTSGERSTPNKPESSGAPVLAKLSAVIPAQPPVKALAGAQITAEMTRLAELQREQAREYVRQDPSVTAEALADAFSRSRKWSAERIAEARP